MVQDLAKTVLKCLLIARTSSEGRGSVKHRSTVNITFAHPSFNSPCGVVYALVTELLTFSCITVCVASTTMLYRVFGCSAEVLWDSCDVGGAMT